MLWILPLVCFSVAFIIFSHSKIVDSWRVSLLLAALFWGLLVVFFTEILSLFQILSYWPLAISWLLSIVAGILYMARSLQKPQHGFNFHAPSTLSRFELSLIIGSALIVISAGLIAWLAPPNNWDAMTYHLSRVFHWIQNRSVENYPTHILRQLYLNPWAEYALLQFQILSEGDHFANLVQWFSMIGSAVGVSLIARQLGARIRGQIVSAVISLTIPMGILQGSSAQNDYVAAFWLVSFVYFGLLLMEKRKWEFALVTGLAFGLALLTKVTAYLYGLPFLIWIIYSLMKALSLPEIKNLLILAVAALSMNLGYYARNVELFGNPIIPASGITQYNVQNETFAFQFVASNLIRNVALHLGSTWQLNDLLEKGIFGIHGFLGIDVNDSRTTWPGTEFHILPLAIQEDSAGNPLQLILIVFGILIFLANKDKGKDLLIYLSFLGGSFLLFCVLIKWQPWNSRLHLPLFILGSPWLGLVFSMVKMKQIVNFLLVLLLVSSLPWITISATKPLFGVKSILLQERTSQYFNGRPEIRNAYFGAAGFLSLSDCRDIGLVSEPDDWEYPLVVLLNPAGLRRLEHVNVENISRQSAGGYPFDPCAIIVIGARAPNELKVAGTTFYLKWTSDPVSIYLLQPSFYPHLREIRNIPTCFIR